MTDTTEARRLADDLSDDADQGQAHIPLLRKSASMLRALADENERMLAELDALRQGRHLTLASPELAGNIARLKKRMADDPDFARGLMTSAGICNEDGSLTERFGGEALK